MKIAFLFYFDKASQIFDNYRDGLRSAIELIGKEHQVEWFLDKLRPEDDSYDFILFWDDSNSEFFNYLDRYPKARKGICLTTDPYNIPNLLKLDVVYTESEPVFQAVRQHGIRTIKAFGTDTDFFKPHKVDKDIEYLYPATFSPWKRQSALAYLGNKLTCIGTVQPDGIEELEVCKKAGVNIITGYIPVEKLRDYYSRTKNIIIPAVHGSERTVIEAMSMNIVPIVTNPQNQRTLSYIEEFKKSGYKVPRRFIIDNYSHYVYARELLKGIE